MVCCQVVADSATVKGGGGGEAPGEREALNLEGYLLELLSAGEQNEWWGLGFWVVQGTQGSVGFNWQLGNLATSWGQGGVDRVRGG